DRDPAMRYDKNTYVATVTVTNNGEGELVTEVSWSVKGDASAEPTVGNNGEIVIENPYAADGEIVIGVTKVLDGRAWKNGDSFDFTIKALDGAPMPEGSQTVTVTAASPSKTAFFGTIRFTMADMADKNGDPVTSKVFRYEVKEIIPKASDREDGMVYDKNTYIAEVTVTDDGSGVLKTAVNWTAKSGSAKIGKNGEIVITNSFSVKTGDTTVILPYAGMFGASALLLICLILRKRAGSARRK
ncbi:MAG: hypothetical protein K5774_02205, partial [Clostridia bacterium]|nr:hypothetical protein [Clostridia bacterium]